MPSIPTEKKPDNDERGPIVSPVLRLLYQDGEIVSPCSGYLLGADPRTIGREAEDGVHLPEDSRLSRRHATVHAGDVLAQLRIVDEGSTNGTFVNGRLVKEALLGDGDVIGVGACLFLLRLETDVIADARLPDLLGASPAARELRAAIAQAAATRAAVLLLGETGVGKEVAARAIHGASGRSGPFLPVNCGAIPEGLAEGLFFGQERGAFTGASRELGYFREAAGGTLFLDEIGELPAPLQPKLLRAIQAGEVHPLGAPRPVATDVRIVTATNRDLPAAIQKGCFRGDLYARLREVPIRLPPLKKRREDVLLLLRHFFGTPAPRLSYRLAEALVLYRWPYNVREVEKLASLLRVRGSGRVTLDLPLIADALEAEPGALLAGPAPPEKIHDHAGFPARREVIEMLRRHRGVVVDVAEAMRRSRKQVYRWLRYYEIDPDAFRGAERER